MGIAPFLERELEIFRKNLAQWKQTHHHQFVLIKGNDIRFYPSFEQAFKDAIQRYDRQGYLLREVEEPRPVFINTRAKFKSNPESSPG